MLSALLSILILVADVWAIVQIAQTNESAGSKALWIVLILFLPVLGLAIWYFAGPKP
jgi:hypothetical protein